MTVRPRPLPVLRATTRAVVLGVMLVGPIPSTVAQTPGDECAGAIPVGVGDTAISTLGATDSFQPVDGTLCPFGGLGFVANDIWLAFTAPSDGDLTVSLCNQVDFDSDLLVYTGGCAGLVEVACSGDAFGCVFTSEVAAIPATAGTEYLIRIGGWGGLDSGSGTVTIALGGGGSEAGSCDNGLDDDTDGLTDCADDDCAADPACTVFLRGDCAESGTINIADAIGLLGYLFGGNPAPPCLEACDADDSGGIDISDAIQILGFLFTMGPPPVDPGPDVCGPDPTPAGPNPCTTFSSCP